MYTKNNGTSAHYHSLYKQTLNLQRKSGDGITDIPGIDEYKVFISFSSKEATNTLTEFVSPRKDQK